MVDLPPWSFSMLEMFAQCPKKAFHKYILKEKQPETEAQRKGNEFDRAVEARLKYGTSLPAELASCEMIAASLLAMKLKGAKLMTQLKVGIRRDFTPCAFFDKDVWGRGALDVALIGYPWAVINDWKTGKNNENRPWYNGLQLKVFALLLLKHFPNVHKVTAFNTYTQESKPGKLVVYTRDDQKTLWQEVLPRVLAVEKAFKTQEWPACAGPLCAWCPVVTCNHHPGGVAGGATMAVRHGRFDSGSPVT